jgi:nucleotide-binding universal stress UspA family protein
MKIEKKTVKTEYALKLEKILVPFDLSQDSEMALKYACWMAKKSEAKITVMHVADVAREEQPDGVPRINISTRPTIRQRAERTLEQAKKIASEEGCGITAELVDDESPGSRIATESGIGKFDLVVIGERGEGSELRGDISIDYLGSVAKIVVEHAFCSVLVVRQTPPVSAS